MVSTILFIQANLQQSIAASSILSRRVSVKEIDMALLQKPRHSEEVAAWIHL